MVKSQALESPFVYPEITDTTLYKCIDPGQSKTYSQNRGKELDFEEVPVIYSTKAVLSTEE